MYDAVLGRFFAQDPLTESFIFQSPYVYASNNPVRFIDYLGMATEGPDYDKENRKKWRQAMRKATVIYRASDNSTQTNQKSNNANNKGPRLIKGELRDNIRYESAGHGNGFFVHDDKGDGAEKAALNFLYNKSQEAGVEMAAYIVESETGQFLYYIQDWSKNEATVSYNLALKNGKLIFNNKSYKVLGQIHTHTTGGEENYKYQGKIMEGPSQADVNAATHWGFPVYSLGINELSRVYPGTGNVNKAYFKLNPERTKYLYIGNVFKVSDSSKALNGEYSIINDLN